MFIPKKQSIMLETGFSLIFFYFSRRYTRKKVYRQKKTLNRKIQTFVSPLRI